MKYGLNAWREAFEQEVCVPREPPALLDVRFGLDSGFERFDRGRCLPLELDRHERGHGITELLFVDGGADRPDHAALAQ